MLKAIFEDSQINNLNKEFKEFENIPTAAELIPFLSIFDDNQTILTKNSSFVRVIELSGFDNISASPSLSQALQGERETAFNNLDNNLEVTFFTFKNKIQNIKEKKSEIEIINNINDLRSVDFEDIFEISIYAVISKKHKFNSKRTKRRELEVNNALIDFKNISERVKANLSSYSPRDLRNTSEDDYKLTKFLNYIINHSARGINSKQDLPRFLASKDIKFEKRAGIISFEDKYCQVINVCVNQDESNEDVMKAILALNIEFDICQNVSLADVEKAKKEIKHRITLNSRIGSNLAATGLRSEDLLEARELVENDLITLFSYSCYIKVFSDSEKDLKDKVQILVNRFSDLGVYTIIETINSKWAFLSSITDYQSRDQRRVLVSGANLSDFIPLFNSIKGFKRNSFGNMPVAQFKNSANLIYNFNFHKDESDLTLGHCLVVGGAGSGKSTLIAFLLMNCLKYDDMKILAFDSRKGLKVPLTLFGGNYSDASNPKEVILNPFSLKENLVNRQFLVKFLSILVGGADINEEATLDHIIRVNYDVLVKKNITASLEALGPTFGNKNQKDNRPSLAKRIEKWIEDPDLKEYFNNKKDNLTFDQKINCFDMGNILDNKTILEPISSYIFHKFINTIKDNPSPHIFLIDEMARYLESKEFSPHIKATLKESRKQNGIFIGCVQEPSTLLASSNIKKDEFLANMATLIIFPDSQANPNDYQELGLNESEFHFVKNTINDSTKRQVLIKQTNGKSCILDINLSSIGEYVKAFSSSSENVELFENLQESSPDNYLERFLKEAR